MILALTSDTMPPGQMYDAASTDPRAEALAGRGRRPGDRRRQLAAGGARRAQPDRAQQVRHRPRGGARGASARANVNRPKGAARGRRPQRWRSDANDQCCSAAEYRPLIVAYRNGAPVRLDDVADVRRLGPGPAQRRLRQRQAGRAGHHLPPAGRQHHRDRRPRPRAAAAAAARRSRAPSTSTVVIDRTPTIRASLHDVERTLVISIALVILVVFLFLRNCARHARSRASPCRCR